MKLGENIFLLIVFLISGKYINDNRAYYRMPSFEAAFTDDEIVALAKYIRTRVPKENSELKKARRPDRIETSQRQRFIIDTVVTGINIPWGLEFLPNGDRGARDVNPQSLENHCGKIHREHSCILKPVRSGRPSAILREEMS